MKAIIRVQKLKTYAQISGVHNHNERTKPILNADPSKQNIRLLGKGSTVSRVKNLLAKCSIKPRKNAVLAAEYLLTASPEAFTSSTSIDVNKWAQANVDFLKRKHGPGLVAAWLHLDETTPHIHAVVVPVLKNEKGVPKLCARDFFGGSDKLSKLQTQYARAMEPFSLERGVKGSKASHKAVKKFYGRLNANVKVARNEYDKCMSELDEPSVFNYKKQNLKLREGLAGMDVLVARAETLNDENKALKKRLLYVENQLQNYLSEYRKLQRFLGVHSIEFVERLVGWATGFLYDPNAPDLTTENRETAIVRVLSCEARAEALAHKWAHVIRRLAADENEELTLKK